MVSCDLCAQVHRAGQTQVAIPEGSVPAEQCNLLGRGGGRGKSPWLNNGDFRDTQLLPWISQVSIRNVVPGVVTL